jgi:hypothetical protein
MDAECAAGKRNLVTGQQSASKNPLTVHARPVCAAKVSHVDQTISLDQDAVHF